MNQVLDTASAIMDALWPVVVIMMCFGAVAFIVAAIRRGELMQAPGPSEPVTDEDLKGQARFYTGRLTQIRPEEGDDWRYGLDLKDKNRCYYCGILFEGDEKKCVNCGGPR